LREDVFSALHENGDYIRGIVTIPESNGLMNHGVIILGAGVNPRQSWHRLSVKIARLLSNAGFYALRIDPRGVGDSDGEIENIDPQQLEGFHDKVQTGLFTYDCQLALTKFKKDFNLNSLFIIGLCGGALTGLYLTEIIREIRGLIYIAGPVTLTTLDVSLPVHPAYARNMFYSYLKKVLNPVAWLRFLSGKSEYKTIFFLVRHKIYQFLGREKTILDRYAQRDSKNINENGDRTNHLNPMIPKAFLNYMDQCGDILFINAEIDQASWGFNNLFAPMYLTPGKPYKGRYNIEMVKKSNHTFSSIEAQKELLSLILNWMEKFNKK